MQHLKFGARKYYKSARPIRVTIVFMNFQERCNARLSQQASRLQEEDIFKDTYSNGDGEYLESTGIQIVGDIESENASSCEMNQMDDQNKIDRDKKSRIVVSKELLAMPEVIQIAESMLEIPNDLNKNWVCRSLPLGTKVLLKTTTYISTAKGNIDAHNCRDFLSLATLFNVATGEVVLSFRTNVPPDTVLHAVLHTASTTNVFDDNEFTTYYHTVHVLDCLYYAGRDVMSLPFETREYYVHTKFEEDELRAYNEPAPFVAQTEPELSVDIDEPISISLPTHVQVYCLKLTPISECSYESLLALYSTMETHWEMQSQYEQIYYTVFDGLQFCHKASMYEAGLTPLVIAFQDEVTAPAQVGRNSLSPLQQDLPLPPFAIRRIITFDDILSAVRTSSG